MFSTLTNLPDSLQLVHPTQLNYRTKTCNVTPFALLCKQLNDAVCFELILNLRKLIIKQVNALKTFRTKQNLSKKRTVLFFPAAQMNPLQQNQS